MMLKTTLLKHGGKIVNPGRSCRMGTYVSRHNTIDEFLCSEVSSYCPMLNLLTKNSCFLDIGGCIGTISCEAALRGSSVHVVEPCPDNFLHLGHHAALNKVQPRVKMYNGLVSEIDAPKNRVLYESQGVNKGTHATQVKNSQKRVPRQCPTIPVDALLRKINQPVNFLKIDCEGDEYLFFEDLMRSLDLRSLKCIAIELHLSKKQWHKNALSILKWFRDRKWKLLRKPNLKAQRATLGIWQRC